MLRGGLRVSYAVLDEVCRPSIGLSAFRSTCLRFACLSVYRAQGVLVGKCLR